MRAGEISMGKPTPDFHQNKLEPCGLRDIQTPTKRMEQHIFVLFMASMNRRRSDRAGQALCAGNISVNTFHRTNPVCNGLVLQKRNPRLLLRLPVELLLRLAGRRLLALLFQLPPRFTRFPVHGLSAQGKGFGQQ